MSGSEKLKFLGILLEDENKRKLEEAVRTPLPGMPDPEKGFPNDNDKIGFPPLISDLTWREAMLLGTILTIFGMNDELKAACIKSARETAPGKFLSIEQNRELFYQPFGKKDSGGPCIIMQSGSGSGAGIWNEVQNRLKDQAYGLSYDRAGLYFSDPISKDQGSIHTALEDFDKMLSLLEEKGEIHPPYILVGHSIGGAFIQLYAHLHPEKIQGIVLVDSTSDAQISDSRMPQAFSTPPHKELPSEELMPISTARAVFQEAFHQLSTHKEQQSLRGNLETLASYTSKADEVKRPFLGNIPLRVVSRKFTPKEATKLSEEHQAALEIQEQLAKRSTTSKPVIFSQNESHFVHAEDPDLVANTIRDLF